MLGTMNSTWKVVCFLLIIYRIIEIQGSFDQFLTLAHDLQKFYLSSSTYIVFDRHELNFNRQRILLQLMKSHSKRDVMSQAIRIKDLERLSNRRENTVYSLIIYNRENLEHAINATKNTDMSAHPWLLYINKSARFDCDNPDKDNFFKLKMDTRMSAICEGSSVLKSYHGIFDNHIEIMDIAAWTPDKLQLEFKNYGSYIRTHSDLKGITLRVAAKVNRSILTNGVDANIANFNFEIMDEIASLSHFNPEIVAVSNELGYLHTKTNKWYGMMKIMNDNVADVGVALFTMSSTRMTAVDYAIPLAKGRCNLYARLPDNTEVRWITYFQVFDKDAWTAIGASILIFSFLVHLIKNGFQRAFIQSFSEDFIKIWGIFSLQSPSDDESSSISIKIIYFSTFFTSTILNVIYSASITSYIAVLSPELPFSTFGEFLRDDSYDLILIQGSRDHSFILSNGSKLTPLQARLRKSCCLPNYAYEGFQQACAEKTAFYTDDVKYDSMQNFLPCKLGAVSMELVEYLSFVMTKNSPYKRAVNYNILRLMDHGILHRLRTKYFRKYAELSNVQPSVITFKEVWPIIVIWIIGIVATVTAFLIEIIVFKFFGRATQPLLRGDRRCRQRRERSAKKTSRRNKINV